MVNFTIRPLSTHGSTPRPIEQEGLVSSRDGLEAFEKEDSFLRPGIEPRFWGCPVLSLRILLTALPVKIRKAIVTYTFMIMLSLYDNFNKKL
jgi:hypothetical protein